ncbi:MAG: diaminopimelate decarboxylase [Gammaproteobacteria bacterium]|nr:diaminopimelate decarboxylase [Gammaproteobacteria bacterium]
MDHFEYHGDELFAEDVPLRTIAEQVGTPCYVYSRATLKRHWHAFDKAFAGHPHQICYSVKANSNLAVLNIFARLGSGFDVVSGGELERVLRAGGNAKKIVFSGVGKTEVELQQALKKKIQCINIESSGELDRLIRIAKTSNTVASIAVRINPDVDAKTHPYIATGLRENKFGVPMDEALRIYRAAQESPYINIVGIACHIGSQLTDPAPHRDALERILQFTKQLAEEGIGVQHIDIGGGLGIRYNDEQPPLPADYARTLLACMLQYDCDLPIHMEPGRAIAGNAGILLTKVEYLKHGHPKNFAVVDAAMNDLLRPALYQAYQEIVPVNKNNNTPKIYDVVGPVCETGDYLGRDRNLSLHDNDLLAIRSAGAYGAVMSSNYNTRPRAAEVMVDRDKFQIVRKRETIDHVLAGEFLLES